MGSLKAKLYWNFRKFNLRICKIGQKFEKGALWGILIGFLFFLILICYSQTYLLEKSFLYFFVFFSIFFVISLSLALLFRLLFFYIRKINPWLIASLLSVFFLYFFLFPYFYLPYLIGFVMICGGILGVSFSLKNRHLFIAIWLFVIGLNFLLIYLLLTDYKNNIIEISDLYWNQKIQINNLDNPLEEGAYKVEQLFYGSGNDKRRMEFKEEVFFKTQSVDVTPFFNRSSGFNAWLRKTFWGFDSKNYPLNGRVWYPQAEGKFPLVVIVHGNYQMAINSDEGYEYLAKFLASRGFIVVSIDENFLNKGFFTDYYRQEVFTRGFLILKHLEYWRDWNEEESNLFYQKVNMDNISLIGHSRGGNAVAVAAAINKYNYYYGNGNYKFDFNFGIKGIVQIAPTDAYSIRKNIPLELENIDLLLLQGSHDQDVYYFSGNGFYNRTNFTDDLYHLKSAIYIGNANHGNFNVKWGRKDGGFPEDWFMNYGSVMKGEEQRRIAKFYISAFLEASLKDKREYVSLLKDTRQGFNYLPETYYISQFEDTSFKYLACFEEDFDITTASEEGIKIVAENFVEWREDILSYKDEKNTSQQNSAVYLRWDNQISEEYPVYTLSFDKEYWRELMPLNYSNFFFFVCNNSEENSILDFTVELVTTEISIRKPLSSIYILPPLIKHKLTKWNSVFSLGQDIPERVLQYVEIPFEEFIRENPELKIEQLEKINFIFDRVPEGDIIIDKIGLN